MGNDTARTWQCHILREGRPMKKNDSENKVIKFPIEKAREAKNKYNKDLTKKEFLKKAAPATLFFVVCVFTFNNILVKNQSSYRTIASDDFTRDAKWEHQLARQLAEKSPSRGIAGIAKTPQLRDELTAVFLHNKYRVEFSNGKIKNIELAELSDSFEPQYVDSGKFIKTYGELFPFSTGDVFEKLTEKENSNTREKYLFMDENKQKKGEIHFELDQYGRLLSVKIPEIKS